MKCRPDSILLLWSGELPSSEERNVREHLAACSECQARLADLEALNEWARQNPMPRSEKDLVTPAILRARQAAPKGHLIAWTRPLALAASVLVLLGIGLLAPRQNEPAENQTAQISEPAARPEVTAEPQAPEPLSYAQLRSRVDQVSRRAERAEEIINLADSRSERSSRKHFGGSGNEKRKELRKRMERLKKRVDAGPSYEANVFPESERSYS